MYDYKTPDGYTDIFFMYVFDATDQALVSGQDYSQLNILVSDGGFVVRAWNGASTMLSQVPGSLGSIQVYGQNLDLWWDTPVSVFTLNPSGQCSSVVPEKEYPDNGVIRFDLNDTNIAVIV